MRILVFLVLALIGVGSSLYIRADGCIGLPFRGPGFDPERGVIAPGAGEKVLLALTYGRMDPEQRATFRAQMKEVLADLPSHEGLIGFAVRKKIFGDEVWTMSAWTNEDALDGFVYARPHREAAESDTIPMDKTVFARRWIPADALPLSWDQAVAILAEESARDAPLVQAAD